MLLLHMFELCYTHHHIENREGKGGHKEREQARFKCVHMKKEGELQEAHNF